jgi:hypothetical protein
MSPAIEVVPAVRQGPARLIALHGQARLHVEGTEPSARSKCCALAQSNLHVAASCAGFERDVRHTVRLTLDSQPGSGRIGASGILTRVNASLKS